ncbi:MAG: hypothetical protein ACJAQ0_000876 [Dasania sp.]
MSEKFDSIVKRISIMEGDNKNRPLINLKSDELINIILQWGTLTREFRMISKEISEKIFIHNASRLSKILSSLVTQIGICDDFIPLPEEILLINHQRRFDITISDSMTSLVYCTHKAIECLALIASKKNLPL